MNWGHKIALVYIAFMAMILTFVFKSAMQDFSLVRPDYYEAEQGYVAQRAAEIRTEDLDEAVQVHFDANLGQLRLEFSEAANGSMVLYRPSNAAMDQTFALQTDEVGVQEISLKGLPKGRWQVVLNWEKDGQSFFKRQDLFIQ